MPRVMAWPAGEAPRSNPYQTLLYRELSRLGWQVDDFHPGRLLRNPPDLLHIHWPDLVLLERRPPVRFAKTLAFLMLFAITRLRRRPLVWTLHNPGLRAEQHSRWGLAYLALLTRLCSGLILLSDEHRGAAPGTPEAVIAQPHYRGVYGPPRDPQAAKAELGLPPGEPVAGFFGKVRPYKNVGALLRSFEQLGHERARLLVAGEVEPSCTELLPALRSTPRAVLREGYVDDAEVAGLLAAMDLVVLPYRELGNSAVAWLALSYDRPVLGPERAASLRELRERVGEHWVRLYAGELSAADLGAALEELPPAGSRPDLDAFEPARIARLTGDFFGELLARSASGRAAPQPEDAE